MSDAKIIVALDYSSREDALTLVDQLHPSACRLKVGKELFTHAGPEVLQTLVERGYDVFLDLKFHDIPNTTAKAVRAAAEMGVWMTNVHALGGSRMMTQAKQALQQCGSDMLLIGVTVLTSMDDSDLRESGVARNVAEQVLHYARVEQDAGLDGVVFSAKEAKALKRHCGHDFLLVTPGIRLTGGVTDDQRRVVTPLDAVAMGSDYLVIGRPITESLSPLATLHQINQSLAIV
jgi:orotidine-5'-phosphate decarboxylase